MDDHRKSLQQILHEGSCSTQHPGFPGHGERGEERSSLSICNWILSWKVILTFQANVCLMFHHGFGAVKMLQNWHDGFFHEKHFPFLPEPVRMRNCTSRPLNLGFIAIRVQSISWCTSTRCSWTATKEEQRLAAKETSLTKLGDEFAHKSVGMAILKKKCHGHAKLNSKVGGSFGWGCYEKKSHIALTCCPASNRGKPRKKHRSLQRLDRIINFLPRVPLKILGGWKPSLKKAGSRFMASWLNSWQWIRI